MERPTAPGASPEDEGGPGGGAVPGDGVAERLIGGFATAGGALASGDSLPARLHTLCRAVTQVCGSDRSCVFLREDGTLRGIATFGNPLMPALFWQLTIPVEAALVEAVPPDRPLVVDDAIRSSLLPYDLVVQASLKSVVIAGIRDGTGTLLGILSAERTQQAAGFSALEADALGVLAQLAAVAVALDRHSVRSWSMHQRRPDEAALSPRELHLLQLIARGHTNEEAARLMHVSVRTVEGYRASLTGKLGTTSRAELVLAAERVGVVAFRPLPGAES